MSEANNKSIHYIFPVEGYESFTRFDNGQPLTDMFPDGILVTVRGDEVVDVEAPRQMIRSSVNGDMVVDFPRPMPDFPRVDLECAYCGQPLGNNNEPIREGPHKGLRPTDLTAYCAASGRDEQVVISAKRIDN